MRGNNIASEDHFFSIGAGSFAALQLIEASLKELGIIFELTDFFTAPVLKDQFEMMSNDKENKCSTNQKLTYR
ncbi:phosphopantetheine-binding protein [Bartonella machadoae]|uniref:phosphopantetheine-binding protein n=1 Tax=Bartonella machadoae TaxID=2893471 RepID=UPI001F4CEC1A|nr:phosphopantetheine-binding protein [Bartonella machadoae]UNE54360.1 phosphopantetheine-binding protein [Bartonella machadoae]